MRITNPVTMIVPAGTKYIMHKDACALLGIYHVIGLSQCYTRYRGYLFFSVKDRNLFHLVNTIGNISTSGKFRSFTVNKICLFHAFNPFWEKFYQNRVQFFSVIPRGVPLPHSNAITILRQAREM